MQAIVRELPKTWSELWKSAELRDRINSKLTLAEYLRYLRKIGSVKRVLDEKNNKILYTTRDEFHPKGHAEQRPPPMPSPRFIRGFDIEELYWGGQELGYDKWCELVQERGAKARRATNRAADLWFKDFFGQKFATEKVGTIMQEMSDTLVFMWLTLVAFYLDSLFGQGKFLAQFLGEKRGRASRRKETYQRYSEYPWFWEADPKNCLWFEIRESLAFLALGIEAGYFNYSQANEAIKEAARDLRRRRKRLKTPLAKLQADFSHQLLEWLTGEDPDAETRAKQIFGSVTA